MMTPKDSSPELVLIDDDPFALKLLHRQLANEGHEAVRLFEQAREAVTWIESPEQRVDLIFCDLDMPDMDGVEVVRRLAEIRYGGALVLCSGEDPRMLQTYEQLAHSHHLQVLGSLSKPVDTDQLRNLLERFAASHPAEGSAERPSYDADELRRALEQDELFCVYQPQIALDSGAVIGVEALVRWRHPADGRTIFPDQFIALAEQNGLIDGLTQAVLARAAKQRMAWLSQGIELQVSVNISMDNLRSLDFPEAVVHRLKEVGMPVASLILEVTESQMMHDRTAALDILTRLRLRRIGLSIDDFGTGHSSLVQLRDIPFQELKIDRSFVNGAGRDPSLRAIFLANCEMARKLNMRTVAEGVEDIDDWEFLRESNCCTLAQGYFINRPLPPREVPDWLRAWEARRRILYDAPRD